MQPPVMFVLTSSQNITITNNLYVHTMHGASSLYKQAESGSSLEQMIRATSRAIMISAVGFAPWLSPYPRGCRGPAAGLEARRQEAEERRCQRVVCGHSLKDGGMKS